MIRIEALRAFVIVAECGNIRDAADRLFRTQSAISMTLKQIEDRLGASLFETDRKHSLTDLGRYVFGVATVLLRDYDHGIDLIEGYALGRTGRLRIASVPSVAALLLPEVLRGFVADRPEAQIELVDTDSTDVRMHVTTGQADLGIASLHEAAAGLHFRPMFEDKLHLICRADADLVREPVPLDWSQLDQVPLILNESVRGLSSPDFKALAANARLTVRNVTSLLAMVQAGVGVTLLPGLATIALPVSLVALPLSDPECRRQVGILHREGRIQSPLAAAFQQHIATAIGPLAERFALVLLPQPD
jgi:DNA-binding transcriptional LysR family regulator